MKLTLIIILAVVVAIALWMSIEDAKREDKMRMLELEDQAERAADIRHIERVSGWVPPRTPAFTPEPVEARRPNQPSMVIRPLPTAKPTPNQAEELRKIREKYGAK